MLKFVILVSIFGSVSLLFNQLLQVPLSLLNKFAKSPDKKMVKIEQKLDDIFITVNRRKQFLFFTLSPLILGLAGFLFFQNLILTLIGGAIGLALPTFVIHHLEVQRKARFQNQIFDTLMILSSSLKSGLSLLQALEVLQEEMRPPMSEEIGLLIRENKMGVMLEDCFQHLLQRMKVPELELVINSILVARETGGDLTKVFGHLATTIRDNRKLKESIRTLTLQGRLQGIIMSALPFFFVWWVFTFNRGHFDIMLKSELGRTLLFVAVVLQIVGMFLIRKFSIINL